MLILFVILRIAKQILESWLSLLNRSYYLKSENQREACEVLKLPDESFKKSLRYTEDRFRFGQLSSWASLAVFLSFLALGGFGYLEATAESLVSGVFASQSSVLIGLVFFGLLGALALCWSTPWEWYRTFKIEEKHGFNRQSQKGFWMDRIKGVALGVVFGGVLIAALLAVMEFTGDFWWFWAWIVMSSFSLLTAWAYPTFLAPLFNKFKPMEEGELKTEIDALAERVEFSTSGISIMDASRRSTHGNAYFTGVFGKKSIVLFDTLVKDLSPGQVVAVLAHELGHFKLHHVRWGLLRNLAMTGVMFFLLSLVLPLESFYKAFGFQGISYYGALVVFSLWFGLIDFFLQPVMTWISRKDEFAADAFAIANIDRKADLKDALVVMSESNQSMPISHPLYSAVYHSHPPLLERIAAMKV